MILLKQPLHHPVWFAQHFRCCHDIYHTVWNIIPLQIGIYVFRCFCKLLILRKLFLPIAFSASCSPTDSSICRSASASCSGDIFCHFSSPRRESFPVKYVPSHRADNSAGTQPRSARQFSDLLLCCQLRQIIVHLIIQTTLFSERTARKRFRIVTSDP